MPPNVTQRDVPLEHVNSAGVDSISTAEKRSLGDTKVPSVVSIGSLHCPDRSKPPVKVYDSVAG